MNERGWRVDVIASKLVADSGPRRGIQGWVNPPEDLGGRGKRERMAMERWRLLNHLSAEADGIMKYRFAFRPVKTSSIGLLNSCFFSRLLT